MDVIIEIKNLTKKIGRKIILHNLSFSIEKGKIVGIVGPNGAGKSTLIKTMLGLYHVTDGDIYINNYSVKKDLEKVLKDIGCIIENPDVYNNLSGRKNIELYAELNNMKDKDFINKYLEKNSPSTSVTEQVETQDIVSNW